MNHQPLTPEQRRAVVHGDGPLLVIAGAGTGKTRVITNRIAYLIEERGVNPYNILAVTFTNAAAEEMSERLASMITGSFDELWIGTFHALGADILRDNAVDFGISPFFRIATPGEQLQMITGELEQLNLTYYRVKGRPYSLLAMFLKTISKAKDELITSEEYERWAKRARLELTADKEYLSEKEYIIRDELVGRGEEMAAVYRRYNELLSMSDALDFGDLIMGCIQLFTEKPHILSRYQERWRYVLVDEFQDTNLAQSRLVDMLVGAAGNVCVVGDDDQSIYRFRGAAIANILEFRRRHPNTAEVYLQENYRSTKQILAGAYEIVKKNKHRLDKKLQSATGRSDTSSLQLVQAQSKAVEADFVAKTIIDLMSQNKKRRLADFAVLAARRLDLRVVSGALTAAGLPFNQAGGGGFFDCPEVKDIIAWLRVVDDPFEADALIRTLGAEPFRLNPLACSRINRWCRDGKRHLIDSIDRVGEIDGLEEDEIGAIKHWRRVFDKLLSLRRQRRSADLMLREILDRTRYRLPLIQSETLENIQKLANLTRLEQLAQRFVDESTDHGLKNFIVYLKLLQASGEDMTAEYRPRTDCVNLLTVHKSKGLEFPVVFLVGVSANTFPGRRRAEAYIPVELLKESTPPDQATHEAEMRRLFYVACTRAKEKLCVVYPASADETGKTLKRSPFLDELAAETNTPVVEVSEDDVNDYKNEIMGASSTIKARFLTAIRRGADTLLGVDEETATETIARQLADYINQLKAHSAAIAEDRDSAVKKIDAAVDILITKNYRSFLKSPEFTAELLQAERPVDTRERQSRLNKVEYRDFLPLNDQGGLTLTVSDIVLYQKCPFAFKVKSIYQIPRAPTPEAEFGVFMHNVLQRFHTAYGRKEAKIERLLDLYENGIKVRRLGRTAAERQLLKRGRQALSEYFDDFIAAVGTPEFFERDFRWHIGPHWITGRVDRADRLPDGGYELIDYKTSKAWQPKQIREDLQLSIYSLAAEQSWDIKPSVLSYYFLLDNKKMPAARSDDQLAVAQQAVLQTAADILAAKFEPKVDYMGCTMCDYVLLCDASER